MHVLPFFLVLEILCLYIFVAGWGSSMKLLKTQKELQAKKQQSLLGGRVRMASQLCYEANIALYSCCSIGIYNGMWLNITT